MIGHVVIEKRQIELNVHGLLKELTRQVEARLRRVDMLIKVEHEVV